MQRADPTPSPTLRLSLAPDSLLRVLGPKPAPPPHTPVHSPQPVSICVCWKCVCLAWLFVTSTYLMTVRSHFVPNSVSMALSVAGLGLGRGQ